MKKSTVLYIVTAFCLVVGILILIFNGKPKKEATDDYVFDPQVLENEIKQLVLREVDWEELVLTGVPEETPKEWYLTTIYGRADIGIEDVSVDVDSIGKVVNVTCVKPKIISNEIKSYSHELIHDSLLVGGERFNSTAELAKAESSIRSRLESMDIFGNAYGSLESVIRTLVQSVYGDGWTCVVSY